MKQAHPSSTCSRPNIEIDSAMCLWGRCQGRGHKPNHWGQDGARAPTLNAGLIYNEFQFQVVKDCQTVLLDYYYYRTASCIHY